KVQIQCLPDKQAEGSVVGLALSSLERPYQCPVHPQTSQKQVHGPESRVSIACSCRDGDWELGRQNQIPPILGMSVGLHA
ncbi:unnamed protein product, partial [Aphanomyces euteiches]